MAESAKAKKERLAIVDFTDPKAKVTPVGQFLADELGTQLLVAGELTVVDRRLVNSTLKKLHITRIDATPPKSVKGAANAIRADAFLAGSYLESQDGVLVTARLLSPLNGQGDSVVHSYFVPGDGNQILALFPELEMVVVFTAGTTAETPNRNTIPSLPS